MSDFAVSLVPAGSMFAFLAGHRQELFGDEDFADLFPSGKGRPSVPASVMASGHPRGRGGGPLRWKVACGFPLDHRGFDPSTLVYWRRLAKSGRPHRISEAVRMVIQRPPSASSMRRLAM